MSMKSRLIMATLTNVLWEVALMAIVLWGLPKLGINIPLGGLIAMMAGLAAFGVISYRIGSRALMKKPVVGLSGMVGSKGKVVTPLAPEGTVRISSELWDAKSTGRKIGTGKEIVVVDEEGLKLIVRKRNHDEAKGD